MVTVVSMQPYPPQPGLQIQASDPEAQESYPPGRLLEHHVQLACLLEVAAAKPGNVTPAHDFADTSYADMVRSALALGPALGADRARSLGVGELIAGGVRATARVTTVNTNLGIVLLFAPLARAAATRRPGETLRAAVRRTLARLDVGDATAAFAAIASARPGGLGEAAEHDVREPARVSLRDAMAAAAHRDSIASEYATGYEIVFATGLPLLTDALAGPTSTLEAIVSLALGLLAERPDTLIARKAGDAVAREVSEGAREVRAGDRTLADFDASLRDAGHRLNPGTTADLVAATLLAALLTGVHLA
jgi:triphosphoribosyl-dephospho-CoA synthase